MTQIDGQVAVVTGGASGIGRGIAEQLLAEGATVIIADIEPSTVETTAAEIGAHGTRVDVSDRAQVDALASEVEARFGAVGILVNNAGIGALARFQDMTTADWRFILDVNLWGVINGVSAFLPQLAGNPRGAHIVNTGSMASFAANQGGGVGYAVTKFGVAALTDVLAVELEEDSGDVHVTLLAPGPIRTNIKTSLRNRPAELAGGLANVDIAEGAPDLRWLEPRDVGRIVTRAIRNNDRYAITHPDWWWLVEERFSALRSAFEAYPVDSA